MASTTSTRKTSVTPRKRAPARTPRKTAARPAAPRKAAARPNDAAAPQPAATKPPKRKLVRDSFTIPRDEYGAIDALKLRLGKLGRIAKKSELLRAGLKMLAALPDTSLLAALEAVPPLKTGRPKKA